MSKILNSLPGTFDLEEYVISVCTELSIGGGSGGSGGGSGPDDKPISVDWSDISSYVINYINEYINNLDLNQYYYTKYEIDEMLDDYVLCTDFNEVITDIYSRLTGIVSDANLSDYTLLTTTKELSTDYHRFKDQYESEEIPRRLNKAEEDIENINDSLNNKVSLVGGKNEVIEEKKIFRSGFDISAKYETLDHAGRYIVNSGVFPYTDENDFVWDLSTLEDYYTSIVPDAIKVNCRLSIDEEDPETGEIVNKTKNLTYDLIYPLSSGRLVIDAELDDIYSQLSNMGLSIENNFYYLSDNISSLILSTEIISASHDNLCAVVSALQVSVDYFYSRLIDIETIVDDLNENAVRYIKLSPDDYSEDSIDKDFQPSYGHTVLAIKQWHNEINYNSHNSENDYIDIVVDNPNKISDGFDKLVDYYINNSDTAIVDGYYKPAVIRYRITESFRNLYKGYVGNATPTFSTSVASPDNWFCLYVYRAARNSQLHVTYFGDSSPTLNNVMTDVFFVDGHKGTFNIHDLTREIEQYGGYDNRNEFTMNVKAGSFICAYAFFADWIKPTEHVVDPPNQQGVAQEVRNFAFPQGICAEGDGTNNAWWRYAKINTSTSYGSGILRIYEFAHNNGAEEYSMNGTIIYSNANINPSEPQTYTSDYSWSSYTSPNIKYSAPLRSDIFQTYNDMTLVGWTTDISYNNDDSGSGDSDSDDNSDVVDSSNSDNNEDDPSDDQSAQEIKIYQLDETISLTNGQTVTLYPVYRLLEPEPTTIEGEFVYPIYFDTRDVYTTRAPVSESGDQWDTSGVDEYRPNLNAGNQAHYCGKDASTYNDFDGSTKGCGVIIPTNASMDYTNHRWTYNGTTYTTKYYAMLINTYTPFKSAPYLTDNDQTIPNAWYRRSIKGDDWFHSNYSGWILFNNTMSQSGDNYIYSALSSAANPQPWKNPGCQWNLKDENNNFRSATVNGWTNNIGRTFYFNRNSLLKKDPDHYFAGFNETSQIVGDYTITIAGQVHAGHSKSCVIEFMLYKVNEETGTLTQVWSDWTSGEHTIGHAAKSGEFNRRVRKFTISDDGTYGLRFRRRVRNSSTDSPNISIGFLKLVSVSFNEVSSLSNEDDDPEPMPPASEPEVVEEPPENNDDDPEPTKPLTADMMPFGMHSTSNNDIYDVINQFRFELYSHFENENKALKQTIAELSAKLNQK